MTAQPHNAYTALSHHPERAAGNEVDRSIYRNPGPMTFGRFPFQGPTQGLVPTGDRDSSGWPTQAEWTDRFEIAWTKHGDQGPLVLMLHGVPCNRGQWEEVQRLLAPFCETINVDMLGMGESSKPRRYGEKIGAGVDQAIPEGKATQWDWANDVDYLEALMQHEYPGRKFFLIADDWGAGIASHYAARLSDRLLGLIELDAIAFDGYPVNEIQAIGRAAMLPNDEEGDRQFAAAFGAFDQALVQILKTMVHNKQVYNQYKLRLLTFPYVDVDYARNRNGDGVTDVFRSATAPLNFHNIRVLSDRAAALSPAQLLPYDPDRQPLGVDYSAIHCPCLIAWGENDTMMPAAQIHRYANVLGTDNVQTALIPNAGHFAHTDQPRRVAETMIDFMRRVVGRKNMGDIYLGNEGIWKGDERAMINELRTLDGIEV
ncbi:alpha/beta fold hydrolase [Thiohalorhabdus methylotrophus]|uniref:Alpha/beta fold hydrolase n=1 Tax=Thiohalorhabdus methylotrophus TaxID=3242694 RepID=A0ABV4TW71_9GAMM